MMLIDFMTYDLKVAVLLMVFYLFYRLLMDRQTFHRLNRWVLLLTLVLSLVLPFCVVTIHHTVWVEAPTTVRPLPFAQTTGLPVAGDTFSELAVQCLSWLLVVGVVLRLLMVGRSFLELRKLISQCEIHPQGDGTVMAVTRKPVVPFSWMHTIVMNHDEYVERNAAVLAHERGHIDCHHSMDVVFVEVLTALQWFNPAVWFLRQDLRDLHECEADQAVLSRGFPTELYVQLLFRKATGLSVSPLANAMSRQILKKRILIMLNNHPNRHPWLRAMYVIPIVALSLVATARTVVEYKTVPAASMEQAAQPNLSPVGADTPLAVADSIVSKPETDPDAPWKSRSMAFSDSVLIILDGVPVSKEDVVCVPKERITSVNVLSKVSAVSAFGEKGSHGAVVISTDLPRDGQSAPSSDAEPISDVSEELPRFPDGINPIQYINEHLAYPKVAHDLGVQGRVIVQFVVEKDGSLSDVHVIRPLLKEVDGKIIVEGEEYKPGMTEEERALVDQRNTAWLQICNSAVDLIRGMPRWTPGKQNGKPVKVRFTIPITFRLS